MQVNIKYIITFFDCHTCDICRRFMNRQEYAKNFFCMFAWFLGKLREFFSSFNITSELTTMNERARYIELARPRSYILA